MQFQTSHKAGDEYFYVTLFGNLNDKILKEIFQVFYKIGGLNPSECWDIWKFPVCLSSRTIATIINNTCFVCGGLMKDGQALDNTVVCFDDFGGDAFSRGSTCSKIGQPVMKQVRKCTSCGHSHT